MDLCNQRHLSWQIKEFQEEYPHFRVKHEIDCGLTLIGDFSFSAKLEGYQEISDSYSIRCSIPAKFPDKLPYVYEIGERIPNGFHTFKGGSLCLGAPIRLKLILAEDPTLSGVFKNLILPYLYNHSYKEKFGELPVGDLAHGAPGLVYDYEKLFNLEGASACLGMIKLLGLKRRVANKKPCPCGSGKRLGKCHNLILNCLRQKASCKFYRKQQRFFAQQLEQESL